MYEINEICSLYINSNISLKNQRNNLMKLGTHREITTTEENLGVCLLRSRNKQGFPFLPLSFNTVLEVIVRDNRQVKLSLAVEDMILYKGNQKPSLRNY